MPSNLSYFNELLGGVPTPPDDYRPGVDPEFNYFPPAPALAPAPAPPGPIGSGIGSGIGHGGANKDDRAETEEQDATLENVSGVLGTLAGVALTGPGALLGPAISAATGKTAPLTSMFETIGGWLGFGGGPDKGVGDTGDRTNIGGPPMGFGGDNSRAGPVGPAHEPAGGPAGGDRSGPQVGGGSAEGHGDVDSGNYHQGGEITDRDPGTYKENMQVNAQEGEFVMSRPAIQAFGMPFFQALNDVAQNGPSEQNIQPIKAALQQITQGMKQAAMSQQPLPQPAPKTGLQRFAGMAR